MAEIWNSIGGCHYRRLSALDKDEVWQEIAREENKQTDKEEREDG